MLDFVGWQPAEGDNLVAATHDAVDRADGLVDGIGGINWIDIITRAAHHCFGIGACYDTSAAIAGIAISTDGESVVPRGKNWR